MITQDKGHTFAWFPKFTQTLETLHGEEFERMARAVMDYGTYGVEPSLDSTFERMYFDMVRDDIDNSVNAREKNGGGRPRKKDKSPGKTPVSDTETPVSDIETGDSTPETQYSSIHTNTNQTNTSGRSVAAAARAAPPARKGDSRKPLCPLCKVPLFRNAQTAKWDCGGCMNSYTDEKVSWG